jgi:hypothetical protein
MTDQNKQLLAIDIERGMVAKSDLTLALKNLRDKNVAKDSAVRTLEEKRVNFEDNKIQTIKLKASIEEQKQEIIDRDRTLAETKEKIMTLKKKI